MEGTLMSYWNTWDTASVALDDMSRAHIVREYAKKVREWDAGADDKRERDDTLDPTEDEQS